jgi:hypothetical protein
VLCAKLGGGLEQDESLIVCQARSRSAWARPKRKSIQILYIKPGKLATLLREFQTYILCPSTARRARDVKRHINREFNLKKTIRLYNLLHQSDSRYGDVGSHRDSSVCRGSGCRKYRGQMPTHRWCSDYTELFSMQRKSCENLRTEYHCRTPCK